MVISAMKMNAVTLLSFLRHRLLIIYIIYIYIYVCNAAHMALGILPTHYTAFSHLSEFLDVIHTDFDAISMINEMNSSLPPVL
jgi:hypothetical protein